ncbi:cysteine proteinase [Hypoxylon trugodes]|uniref:cysteine proteinase n=1 Tax=Hypoxylon trugodes TaxID=326681 RepID=UPI0021A117CE|nr:cysteine proteinase [Hypoxylon trugodes]KAI1388448.1 cysteine proteinase [Hypoxylon trugodes]
MASSQHDLKDPCHFPNCHFCLRSRARIIRHANIAALRVGRDFAVHVGSSDELFCHTRTIRVPRSNRSVTIQVPDLPRPVLPISSEGLLMKRKRPYWQTEYTGLEPSAHELTPFKRKAQPVQPRLTGHAEHYRLTQSNAVRGILPPPKHILPLSPGPRKYISRPEPSVFHPRWDPLPVAPKPQPRPMPGAWPSEFDEEDGVEATPTGHDMTIPTKLSTNFYNVASFLRESSYGLLKAFSNRIFPTNHQGSTIEDGGPTSKRRRLDSEGFLKTPRVGRIIAPAEPIGDPMDIDSPIVTENRHIKTESPSNYSLDMGERQMRLQTSPSQSPVVSPNSAAAAKRATQLFPKIKKHGSRRSQNQTFTPSLEDRGEKQTQRTTELPIEHTWKPLGKPKYASIQEFFEHDHEFCLPGLEAIRLTPNDTKVYELDSLRQERLRLENERLEKERLERLRIEEERINESLRPLGLRKAKAPLITPLDKEWAQRVGDAIYNGYAEENKWRGAKHRDGVELTPRDFAKLVPPTTWLNDNVIQATLVHLATYINDAAGVIPKSSIPKCVALSSQYWSNFIKDYKKNIFPRGLSRNWGVNPDNFLGIDTVLIPINESRNHWTLLIIRPSRRSIAYVDSFHSSGLSSLRHARGFVETLLKDKYVAGEWREEEYTVPKQENGHDCGVFVITNSIYLALGLDPSDYSREDMPLQRRRITAMLLNGGFTGPFDLSKL